MVIFQFCIMYIVFWKIYVFNFVCFTPSKSLTFSDFISKLLNLVANQNSNSVPDISVVGYGTAPSIH